MSKQQTQLTAKEFRAMHSKGKTAMPEAFSRLAIRQHKQRKVLKKGTYTFFVNPMGKPSFQKSDKFRTFNNPDPRRRQRNVVTKWIAFKQELFISAQQQGFIMPPIGAVITFFVPIPESKRNKIQAFTPHQQKPDLDNMLKAFFDSVCPEDDSYIYQYSPAKYWSNRGKIEVIIQNEHK